MSTNSSMPPDPPAQEERKVISTLADHYFPDSRGLPKKKRRKLIAILTVSALLLFFGSLLAENYFGLLFSGNSVRREDEAQKRLDLEGEAFTAQVTEPVFDPTVTPFDFIFDHPLTPAQEKRMQGFSTNEIDELWDYLSSIGGRMVEYPAGGTSEARSSVFNLHLQSDRQAPLTVTDLRVEILHCAPSTAEAIVRVPPQGGGGYFGIFFDLTERDPIARISEPTKEFGDPFFRDNVINLGNGEDPGNFRVESVAERQSCDWEIEVSYADSSGVHTRNVNNNGHPFRTEALPRNPRQYWLTYPGEGEGIEWVNCSRPFGPVRPHADCG
ncbi:hypothetical protein [Streptomyces tauricus]|uniref:hypothetical protein n=1 Tax=Streptomyces tauricus TaxID=68274 RepID=UPI0033A9007A